MEEPWTRIRIHNLCYRDVDDLDVLLRLLLVHPGILDLMNNVESLCSSAEYGVFLV